MSDRFDPNVYFELEDMAQWQSIREALGDTICRDTAVEHEPSFEERQMAQLVATFPGIADPTNTVAMQTAPEFIPVGRNGFFRGVMVALVTVTVTALIVFAAVRGLTS